MGRPKGSKNKAKGTVVPVVKSKKDTIVEKKITTVLKESSVEDVVAKKTREENTIPVSVTPDKEPIKVESKAAAKKAAVTKEKEIFDAANRDKVMDMKMSTIAGYKPPGEGSTLWTEFLPEGKKRTIPAFMLPVFVYSLDAVRKAEANLSKEQWPLYIAQVNKLWAGDRIHAPARIKVEAMLAIVKVKLPANLL